MGSNRPRSDGGLANAAAAAAFLADTGRGALAQFLARQRWFAARGRVPRAIEVLDWAALGDQPPLLLMLVAADGERYYLPVAVSSRPTAPDLVAMGEIAATGDAVVHDAHAEPEFGRQMLVALATGATLPAARGRFECGIPGPWPGPAPEDCKTLPVQMLGAEQSNTSLRLDRRFLLKSIRRPATGPNPEFEISHFLATRTGFGQTPGLAGWVDHVDERGARTTVALLQPWVEHEGDGWSVTLLSLRGLADQLSREPLPVSREGLETRLRELAGDTAEEMQTLGTVTAALHVALASDPRDPAFGPAPIGPGDVATWAAAIEEEAQRTVALVAERRAAWPGDAAAGLAALVAAAPDVRAHTAALATLAETGVHRIRCHGDYHLGQVLKAAGSFLVIDFEGEPARPLAERRAKHTALRDVAGMLRSFAYAARTALRERGPGESATLWPWLEAWERLVREAFRRGYLAGVSGSAVRLVPPGDQEVRGVIAAFELEKAFYEVRYELGHRPEWVGIPLADVSRIMGL